jgi:hypothetical protein
LLERLFSNKRVLIKKNNNQMMKKNYFQILNISPTLLLSASLLTSATVQAYDYSDNQPYSQEPPANLARNKVPLFVSIGFDDNAISGIEGTEYPDDGMTWILNFLRNRTNPLGSGNSSTYDGSPVRVTFFNTSNYQEIWEIDNPDSVKQSWKQAFNDGHEIGNHTASHPHGNQDGNAFDFSTWNNEINGAQNSLINGLDISANKISGFRTPFLEYNEQTFKVLTANGLTYDTSIEEGWNSTINGSNFPWPYTLNEGSPGDKLMVSWGFPNKREAISEHPGLWELGVNPLIIPERHRASIKSRMPWLNTESGKITAFDWNLWVGAAKMTKQETLDTLKHTLDLRLQGNRAPLMIGAHTGNFSSARAMSQISVRQRKEVIQEFIDYALSKPDVRIVPFNSIVNWMRSPSALTGQTSGGGETPWNRVAAIGDEINLLQENSDNLDWDLFQGGEQGQNQVSADLASAASACWDANPSSGISKLNTVLSYLDQKIIDITERNSMKQQISGYISRLRVLETEIL